MRFGAANGEPAGLGQVTFRANPFLFRAEIGAGGRVGIVSDFIGRADGHHVAAAHAGARSEVDDQVGGLNRRFVVLDDQDAVAQLFEPTQRAQQHGIVARMKTDGRFVENVTNAAQIGAELGGEPDALRLAAGKRIGAPVEGQIGQADFGEEI